MQSKNNPQNQGAGAPRLEEVVEVADPLELRAIDIDTGETKRYKSTVQDLTAEGIFVSLPTDQGRSVTVQEGEIFIVSLWKDYADHIFKSTVLQRVSGRMPQLLLASPAPGKISRNVRREFFRVDTKIPVRLQIADANGQMSIVPGTMVDLSGGGGRMQVLTQLPVEGLVRLNFDLPFPDDDEGNDRVKPVRQLSAQIKTCTIPAQNARDPETKRQIFMLGLEFGQIDKVEQNNVMRYVAFRQRELLMLNAEGHTEATADERDRTLEAAARLDILEQELADAGQQVPDQPVARPDKAVTTATPPPLQQTPVTTTRPPRPQQKPAAAPTAPTTRERLPTTAPAVPVAPKQPPTAPPPQRQTPATPPNLPPTAVGNTPPTERDQSPARKTVLLVEDEEPLRRVLVEAMDHFGYDTIEAEDGQQGLELALTRSVDLIITDLMMPKMNGWRLIASLRDKGIEVPIVIVTGYMSEEGQEVLTSKDVSSFLVKPIAIEELHRVVKSALEPKRGQKRILAVDDEEDMRVMVSTCLRQAGFEVETAASGGECLDKVSTFKPDLVVLDIVMPGLDGFKVCSVLRAQPSTATLPVIMLTAKGSAEYVRRAVSLKINGYIVKPFDAAVLVNRICKTLSAPAR